MRLLFACGRCGICDIVAATVGVCEHNLTAGIGLVGTGASDADGAYDLRGGVRDAVSHIVLREGDVLGERSVVGGHQARVPCKRTDSTVLFGDALLLIVRPGPFGIGGDLVLNLSVLILYSNRPVVDRVDSGGRGRG